MVAAADAMLMPFDERAGVYAQDDAFFGKQPWPFADTPTSEYPLLLHHHPLKLYRHQVSKQADAVLALALMPGRFEQPMARRMIDAYAAVTVHDSTLSASAFATACARAGDAAAAVGYWRTALLTDACDLFGNTGHGLHMAAMAGSWTTIAMGFGGMSVLDGVLCFDPIAIPEIGTYCFRVVFRGSLVEVTVDGADATYELLDGAPVMVSHKGDEITLRGPKVSMGLVA
jgi:alpha,alpha-trehalose phosphorylase